MEKFPVILLISSMTVVIGCNKGYGGGLGWGDPHLAPVIILPKPTLLPKLKQAFIDGKLSVDYHKIVAPSLKPLPYKKGVGWIGKGWGWGHGFNAIGHGLGWDHFDHFGVGKTGLLGVGYGKGFEHGKGFEYGKEFEYGKGFGYGKAIGVGKGLGIGFGKDLYGYGGLKGPIGHHHIPVTPITPLDHKLPLPHGPIGHIGHTVSQNSVTVVEKGVPLPHDGLHHGPIGNDLYGK